MKLNLFKHKRLSLRLSLSAAFIGLVIITSLVIGIATYRSVHFFIRQDIRERLHDVVGIAALQIDPEIHKTLIQPSDEETENYKSVKCLQKIRNKATL